MNALPVQIPNCKLARSGVEFEEKLDIKAWAEIGVSLCSMGEATMWWLGDWLNYGNSKYGEKYKEALSFFGKEVLGDRGYSYQTLRDSAYVASRVQLSWRHDNLSFEHHKVVAPYEPKDQKKWLKHASENDLSAKELRAAIKADGTIPQAKETNSTHDVFMFERWVNEAIRGFASFPVSEWQDDVLTKRIETLANIEKPLLAEAQRRNLNINRVKALEGV